MIKELEEALEPLDALDTLKSHTDWTWKDAENYEIIKSALERFEELKNLLWDLFHNHIELIIEDNGNSYYKIKGSKGKEKSCTSKHIADVVLYLLEDILK